MTRNAQDRLWYLLTGTRLNIGSLLFAGSLQRGSCRPHLRGRQSHLWFAVFPQPRGHGTVRQPQPLRHRPPGSAVRGSLRVPHRLPLAMGGRGHFRAAGDPAGNSCGRLVIMLHLSRRTASPVHTATHVRVSPPP